MRQKRALCLLAVVSILGLAGFFVCTVSMSGAPESYVEEVMGIYLVEDLSCLEGKTHSFSYSNPGILYEGEEVPYVNGDSLYLSQNTGDEWEGRMTTSMKNYYLCAECDGYWHDKAGAMADNYRFLVYLVGKDDYYMFEMVVTGIPIICIETERVEDPEEVIYEEDPDKYVFGSDVMYYGSITVFDPGVGGGGYEIQKAGVRYHQKGATSAIFNKQSYSISLLDEKESKLNLSLLGMRSDNSWKLNALCTDENRIREITASQIWEEISDAASGDFNESGPRMEYAELIMDGDYKGIYCLVEPVDRKKLDLDDNDYLYKILSHDVPPEEYIAQAAENGWKVQYPIRIRYPDEIFDYAAAWYPVSDYLDLFRRGYEIEDIDEASSRVIRENICDFYIFLMSASVSDNNFKNTYLAADVDDSGDYVMRIIPWDLDYSFGNVYSYGAVNASEFNDNYTVTYYVYPFEALKYYGDDEITDILTQRWETYRESFLATDNIIEMLTDNYRYLTESGAYQREKERWPDLCVSTDIDDLLTYQENRMEWLDGYFQ